MFKIPIHGGVDLFGAYKNKVYSGGGSIRNEFVAKTILNFYKNSGQLNNLRLLVAPELGMTLFNDGTDLTVSKLYSVDSTPNNLTQTTANSHPYLAGDIAPTEKYSLNNPNGATRFMTHPEISYSATDKWSVTFVVNNNASLINPNSYYYAGGLSTLLGFSNTSSYIFRNESNNLVSIVGNPMYNIGKLKILTLSANGNNELFLYVNGTFINKFINQTNVTFSRIISGLPFQGKLYFGKLQNGSLSASEVKYEYDMLRSIYPEIESIQIGTKTWATSNFEAVASANGTIIADANVQATWQTGAAGWAYHTGAATTAIYGKLYNRDARNIIIANPPSGWHIATEAELTTLVDGGANVLKANGTGYWITANGTNTTGLTILGGGSRNADGTFNTIKSATKIWCADSDKCFVVNDDNTCSISAITAKEGAYIRLVKD